MMDKAIRGFPAQFGWEPIIENEANLPKLEKFVFVGMGGSHLSADLLCAKDPSLNAVTHTDYGLPALTDEQLKERLIILMSYSGNTEEVLDAFQEGKKKMLNLAVIASNGKLLEEARKHSIPYVQLPDTGIQPRSALGFSVKALVKLLRNDAELAELSALAGILETGVFEESGKALALTLQGKVPVVYSSFQNKAVAYNWKIKLNETGKIPAFYNMFPELNHNEMTGFDIIDSTKQLSAPFHFVFLKDSQDHPRVSRRMDICKSLYQARGLSVETVELAGHTRWERIFGSLLIADWAAYYTALAYGADPEQVPMVEEFKKLMA
jgi:glucose/mannose-6-phosphate isomerase